MFVRRAAVLAGFAFAGVALVFLYRHDPSSSHLYPRCVFHALTGLQCPGCGATRALYCLLHGEIVTALRFNALFVLFSSALAIAGASEAVSIWNRRTVNVIQHPWIGWAIAVAVIGWGVIRNL